MNEEQTGIDEHYSPITLHIIRGALLFGVVLLGGAVWYIRQQGSGAAMAEETALVFRYVLLASIVVVLGAVHYLRNARLQARGVRKQASLCIVGWAIAEGYAMAGAVYWILVGSATFYLVGILLMLGAFALLQVPTDDD